MFKGDVMTELRKACELQGLRIVDHLQDELKGAVVTVFTLSDGSKLTVLVTANGHVGHWSNH